MIFDDRNQAVYHAALALIAEEGLAGLTYRALAVRAGLTLGELTAHVGKKAGLFDLLMGSCLDDQASAHQSWQDRMGRLRPNASPALSAVLQGYLRDLVTARRGEITLWCELGPEIAHHPGVLDFIQAYSAREQRFWHGVLSTWSTPCVDELALVVRAYVLAEASFLLALAGDPGYEIALAANLGDLASLILGESLAGHGSDSLLPALRQALGVAEPDLALQGARFEVGVAAARVVAASGVARLTHRAVAAELGHTASAVSYHFVTKAELVHGALLAMHAVLLGGLDMPSGRGARPADFPSDLLVTAIHSLALTARRSPEFRPALLCHRLERGRSTGAWLGLPPEAPGAQLVSLFRYGLALGREYDEQTLSEATLACQAHLTSVLRNQASSG